MSVIHAEDLFLYAREIAEEERNDKKIELLFCMDLLEMRKLCCQLRYGTYRGNDFELSDLPLVEFMLKEMAIQGDLFITF